MEILIPQRCVQGHEGALCFIITPRIMMEQQKPPAEGLKSALGPDNWFRSEIYVSANVQKNEFCSWLWCLAFRSVSEVDIFYPILEKFRPCCHHKTLHPKPRTLADEFFPVDRCQWKLPRTLISTGWLYLKGLASGKIRASGEFSGWRRMGVVGFWDLWLKGAIMREHGFDRWYNCSATQDQ